jgi:Arc/MetJ family transcription regulator
MRTTLDIDRVLLERAARASGAKTKKALVEEALLELVRSRNLERLRRMIGSEEHEIGMTAEELDDFRGRDRTALPD